MTTSPTTAAGDPGPSDPAGAGPTGPAPTAPGPAGAHGAPRTAFWDWLARLDLRRSDERWLGGVAAGVADRLGIDPVLLRVLVVVVSLLGGAGLVLYAAAWLLLPDRAGRIEARALVGGEVSAAALLALGLVAVATVVPDPWSWAVDGQVVTGGDVVALVVVGVALVVAVALLPRLVPVSAGGVRPDGGAVRGPGSHGARSAPPRAQQAAVPAWLTCAVLGLGLLAGAATWLAARPEALRSLGLGGWRALGAGQEVLTTPQVVALAVGAGTAVLAVALLAAGLAGRRGDGLGFWAVSGATTALLALGVPPGADVRAVGDVDWRPLTAAQAERGFASWAGDSTLDLRALTDDPAATGRTVRVELRHGFGDARVVVPAGAEVEVRTGGVIGAVVTRGEGWTTRGREDGFFTSTTSTATPVAGGDAEAVRLLVDARTAIGQLEVVRSAA
ncbi:PspC domain-containing protein [Quadrisphaera sp. KR29]|uniref:PspC domain-containing protein n=1 Tax=Quadrisphaera sp. KR29 TaxID=3461391 RepID=UPI004044B8C5